jgi:cadmium resistance protein CadD (predicted permease)
MDDRTTRFAARMIAVGLLGVAWTIATFILVVIEMSDSVNARLRIMGYLGLAPVALMLFYVIATDYADYKRSRGAGKSDPTQGD